MSLQDQDLSYMAHCLRRANATQMVNKEWDGIVFGIMACPFVPVFDGIFFPESPAKALKNENFKKTKILLGTNSNEGLYFVLYYLTDIFKKQENISITREQFRTSVGDLNPIVSPGAF
jgi:acetylcholinesterase